MNLTGKKNNKGITLYFALIIISALMLMGFFVIELARKEVIFSSYGRESQVAFYAAESGLECAWYYDQKFDYFFNNEEGEELDCGYLVGEVLQTSADDGMKTDFTFNLLEDDNSPCVKVTVEVRSNEVETSSTDSEGNPITVTRTVKGGTVITSRGINTCNEDISRRFERAIELRY